MSLFLVQPLRHHQKNAIMKKLYLLSLTASLCLAARAQINKGDLLLGGNLSYQSETTSTVNIPNYGPTKTTGLTIDPSFAKAFKNNAIAGFDVEYGHSTYNPGQGGESTVENLYGLGVFLRRYRPLGNGFYLFGQARLGGTYDRIAYNNLGTGINSPTGQIATSGQVSFTLFPGIAYALNRHWQIETGLPNFLAVNYNHNKETTTYAAASDQVSTMNTFNLTSSLTGNDEFSVGVRYIIGN
jgi:hypothetical protein